MKLIICYGDSNTYGYDPRSYLGGRYDRFTRWTGILEQSLEAKVVNEGLNGRSIPRLESQVDEVRKMIRNSADQADEVTFLIMLGTNDLLMHPKQGAQGVAACMQRFLTALMQENAVQSEKVKLVLMVPAMIQPGTWVENDVVCLESKMLGDHYEALAEKMGIDCIRTDYVDVPVLFDGVHFSELGHKNMADYLLKCFSISG